MRPDHVCGENRSLWAEGIVLGCAYACTCVHVPVVHPSGCIPDLLAINFSLFVVSPVFFCSQNLRLLCQSFTSGISTY